jgi:hypothetical protein
MITADKLELTVAVQGGRLNPSETQKALIGGFLTRRGDKPVVVKIAKPTNSRSVRQNRLYWGVVLGTIAADTGNTTEDLHLILKDMFLPRKFITLAGKEVEVRKTTTDLSTEEFGKYLTQIAAWAATELGIQIPLTV